MARTNFFKANFLTSVTATTGHVFLPVHVQSLPFLERSFLEGDMGKYCYLVNIRVDIAKTTFAWSVLQIYSESERTT